MRLILLLLATGFISTCAAQFKDERVEEFLGYLKVNDEQKIFKISYPLNVKNNITDNDLRKRNVAMASELLNKYLVSPKNKWQRIIIEPDKSRTVEIPLISGGDSLIHAIITLYFPPASVSDRVYTFKVVKNDPKLKIEAPQVTH